MHIEARLTRLKLDAIHFCGNSKVQYRVHLTLGMLLSTLLGMAGTHYGHAWMVNVSLLFNLLTAVIWIWE